MGDSMTYATYLAEGSGGSGAFNLILLLAIPVVFYLLLIRPQSKRRREQLQMQSSIEPGARVLTTSGMYAEVVSVDDDGIVLEIAPGVEARFVKQAVMNVVDAKGAEAADLDGDDEDDDASESRETEGVDLAKDEDADGDAKQKADKHSA
ncbi:preprotein translocase subunit YajC [Thermomonospora umbrina]|uniref:Protein translocase subunit yajC n=1 Tax=Thermomonospora umbrina TaxID=111806 RepID=A0A3D9SFH5_9ACTN|nr:preprotein translocase subunit YajC [Thermomonospora umbrina]REE94678.1 protein translocase subunit yajC [Thermomonospora umbrina]